MTEPGLEQPVSRRHPDIEPLDWIFLLNTRESERLFFRVSDMPEILKTLMQDHLSGLTRHTGDRH